MDKQHYQGLFWTILGLLQSKKDSDCKESVFLLKHRSFYKLIKQQNISNQSSS